MLQIGKPINVSGGAEERPHETPADNEVGQSLIIWMPAQGVIWVTVRNEKSADHSLV